MVRDIPDWALGPNSVLDDEEILDELGVNKSDLPRLKSVVAHNNYERYQEEVIRIEMRIGSKGSSGWGISDKYDEVVSKLESHSDFITKRQHLYGDPTYVSFFFDVPEAFEGVYEHFEE